MTTETRQPRSFLADHIVGQQLIVNQDDTGPDPFYARFQAETGISLPENFAFTGFDQAVLGKCASQKKLPATQEIVDGLQEDYYFMLDELCNFRPNRGRNPKYNEIEAHDINNYFTVIMGAEGHEHEFPEIRARYNLLENLHEDVALPTHKTDMQFIVATLLTNGRSMSDIVYRLDLQFGDISGLIDMMKLDIFEYDQASIIEAINDTVDATESSAEFGELDTFLARIKNGDILKSPPRTMTNILDQELNATIASLWLEKLEESYVKPTQEEMLDNTGYSAKDIGTYPFSIEREYIRNIIETYVKGFYVNPGRRRVFADTPRGTVNQYLGEVYGADQPLGGRIIRLFTGSNFSGRDIQEIVGL